MQNKLVATSDDAGSRLDKFVLEKLTDAPKSLIAKLIRTKDIKVNGLRSLPGYRMQPGDTVTIYGKFTGKKEKAITHAELPVLYEDNDLLIINKPAGLAVQGGTGQTKSIDKITGARLVHRLDKDTSGVLIMAKSLQAAKAMAKMFADGKVTKKYIAVCTGRPPENKGTIDAPLSKIGEDIVVNKSGLPAQTDYQVLASNDRLSCILAKPHTGRTHQIRVHLAYVKSAILGDKKYNKPLAQNKNRCKINLYLHAAMVQFVHPTVRDVVKIIALPPKHIKEILALMEYDYENIKNHLEND